MIGLMGLLTHWTAPYLPDFDGFGVEGLVRRWTLWVRGVSNFTYGGFDLLVYRHHCSDVGLLAGRMWGMDALKEQDTTKHDIYGASEESGV